MSDLFVRLSDAFQYLESTPEICLGLVRTSTGMASSNQTSSSACPVDHSSTEAWANMTLPPDHPPVSPSPSSSSLPITREISSIPRADGEKWVYPSQSQFYNAMARKNHDPKERDMQVLVPIHNAVNERAWSELMAWERGQGGDKCGGVKLVSFKGRPKDRTIRAQWNILLG